MPPLEQYYEDGDQGAWTDIYALAGVCYKMITGEKPPEAVARVKRDSIIKLSETYKGKYNRTLLHLLDKCLLVDEEKRPKNVDECLQALETNTLKATKAKATKAKAAPSLIAPTKDTKNAKAKLSKKIFIILVQSLVLISLVCVLIFVSYLYIQSSRAEKFYEEGLSYYKGDNAPKDYKIAIEYFEKAADLGHTGSLYYLGLCYEKENDFDQAVCYYEQAAELGHTDAQCGLGVCYANGDGVNRDVEKAFYWFKKAAEQGNDYAQHNLGICYANGNGVNRDVEKAFYWFKKAAEQGNAKAQVNLGICYEHGYGVNRDLEKAVYWFKKAAEQKDSNAIYELKRLGEYL